MAYSKRGSTSASVLGRALGTTLNRALGATVGSSRKRKDPNYTPPIAQAIPLGIQHILAMFISNITPAIIICGAAGFVSAQIPRTSRR